jgi:hypothetical protein
MTEQWWEANGHGWIPIVSGEDTDEGKDKAPDDES